MSLCPCCSGKEFRDCCESIIENQSAPTAEQLMRSRYTAYCLEQVDYILSTTHSKTRKQYHVADIAQWAKESNWQQLKVLKTEKGGVSDLEGIVEFKAYYLDAKGKQQIHHEQSFFEKQNGQWYYVEGIIDPPSDSVSENKINRNDPCPCGSGKKYKKCCA